MEKKEPIEDRAMRELLLYRFGPIWDGNVNSKSVRDYLVSNGFLNRATGFQFLSPYGVRFLRDKGLLNESTWRENPIAKWNGKGNF